MPFLAGEEAALAKPRQPFHASAVAPRGGGLDWRNGLPSGTACGRWEREWGPAAEAAPKQRRGQRGGPVKRIRLVGGAPPPAALASASLAGLRSPGSNRLPPRAAAPTELGAPLGAVAFGRQPPPTDSSPAAFFMTVGATPPTLGAADALSAAASATAVDVGTSAAAGGAACGDGTFLTTLIC